ncbi:MAG: hypothetical protein EOP51_03410 [Sphingobacteriales bacterium]|nr:MAG: hypothetical protein EOP51_03410 [Sphingobacteriales bacterium]
MKKLYTLLLATAATSIAQAQITLNASSYTNVVITGDTTGVITADRPVLEPSATAQLFDFTGIGYGNTRYYSLQATGANAAFPNAGFWENRGYQQGADSFESKRWSGITPTGIVRFGESMDRQAISLRGVPGGTTNDSLIVLAQNSAYTTPYTLIPFPTTYGDSWSSDFSYDVNMELTLGATYQQATFRQKTSVSYDFAANGFGHFEAIKVDNGYGQAEVLMVRVSSKGVDSFFVNGAPAPAGLLTTLGLTQNRTTFIYFDELFRPNEVSPLVLYNYGNDGTFTNVVSNSVHQDRMAFATNISEITRSGNLEGPEAKLYPNVLDGQQNEINLYLPTAKAGNYTYAINNAEGKVVYQANTIIEKDGKAIVTIALPTNLINGAYWLRLSTAAGKEITVQPLRYTAQ